MKNLLFIAPLPPPITGQSLASQALFEGIKDKYNITVINFSRKNALNRSKLSLKWIFSVLKMAFKILYCKKSINAVYFTITQSRFGNLKDILFLAVLGRKLLKKTIVHLHGGYFDKLYYKSPNLVKYLNKKLFKNVAFGIVLGNSLKKCLEPVINENKIKTINNFYQDYLKISYDKFNEKWDNLTIIRVLYLSNIMTQKGYNELIEAYKKLDDNIKEQISLDFAGDFESEDVKNIFFNKIKTIKNISYLGVVKSEEKKNLLHKSHIFILPTFYHIEGQPISILEAYASGLYVITTDQGGICDVFKDGVNGKLIEKRSVSAIELALNSCVKDAASLRPIAENNLIYSKEFSSERSVAELVRLIDEIA
ncbi:MAG TPA: glycosyltransferase family 4 protein [Spirochaetota bacterium]|nr:glycosyltransferase family 4 protein [Spirochaetota bacterium]HOS32418.1 glycosyltransferase family 4 protein [Spirochaetota bacterium]HOS55839.1 glycosyltransferase family 4 protein [Spirochaetota bacterium]HQF77915.1 glycosyltransferase family 4 protein [Spirochaetota bacterium]HQH29914.1 glycosyltransferase family 4 protein [Spirochaetota bacterium]